jgi:hypothetical protein
MDEPETRLQAFIDRFDPAIAALARACRARMRARLPNALELVYDNYGGLGIGYAATEKLASTTISIFLYPRLVRFFFLYGADLEDPEHLLEGEGSRVRSIKAPRSEVLDEPAVVALIEAAIDQMGPMPTDPGRTIIKSISARQMPRRPRPKTPPR